MKGEGITAQKIIPTLISIFIIVILCTILKEHTNLYKTVHHKYYKYKTFNKTNECFGNEGRKIC